MPKSIAIMYESPILGTSRSTQKEVKNETDQIQQLQCTYVIWRRCSLKGCHPQVSQTLYENCFVDLVKIVTDGKAERKVRHTGSKAATGKFG